MVENQIFTQLSDHYGLSVELSYKHGEDETYDSSILKMNNKFEGTVNQEDENLFNKLKDEI